MEIKVFVVDDHRMVREGIISMLALNSDIELVGEADNGEHALKKINDMESKPDVILMDVNMPVMDGVEATKEISKRFPDIKIIALTMAKQSTYIKKMLQSGAQGYLLKEGDRNELIDAIKTVYEGKTFYSKKVSNEVMTQLSSMHKKSSGYVANFTSREKEVLKLITKDKTNQEIADDLFISIRTVESHKQNLLSKTHSNSIAGVVVYALKHNLVDLEET